MEKHTPSESHFVDRWKLAPLAALKGGGEKSSTLHQHIFSVWNESDFVDRRKLPLLAALKFGSKMIPIVC